MKESGVIALMLSKVEIDILKNLYEDGLTNEMDSRSIKNIAKEIELNYRRTRDNVMKLLLKGYVKQGWKERQSNTFHITKEGIEILK